MPVLKRLASSLGHLATRWRAMLAPGIVVVAFLAYWVFDHTIRFYLGDSTAYLMTGLSGWIPPDRSWAYGFASRWLVTVARHIDVLVLVQCLLLALAILVVRRLVQPRDGLAALLFCALVSFDPLLQMYTRFWLSDAPALAFFLIFLAALSRFVAPGPDRLLPGLAGLAAIAFLTFSIRVAYVPAAFAIAVGCVALSFRSRMPVVRRRAVAACLVVPLAVLAVAGSNSVVSMERFHGQLFLNQMSGLYELGVFTPALRPADFTAAGVPMPPATFDAMHLWRYDDRGAQVWSDNDTHLRAYLQKVSGYKDVYDPRFQALCHRIVTIGMLHHPQTFVGSYLYGLALYLTPKFYVLHFDDEMGLNKDLPESAVGVLRWITGSNIGAASPRVETPLIGLLRAVMPAYVLIMLAGLACAVRILCTAGRTRGHYVLALGLVFSVLTAPIYSHGIKARYVLSAVVLSYAMFACVGQRRQQSSARDA